MKKNYLKMLCIMMLLCISSTSWALEFVSNGIKYSADADDNTATVIANSEKYSGDIVIPATVTPEGGGELTA